MTANQSFPSRNRLWHGAILMTIAYAIDMVADPSLEHELSWDGRNYSRQDSQGTRGTVTFASEGLVFGAFRDDNDPRVPWRTALPYKLEPFLHGIPDDLRSLAEEEALQYLLEEVDGQKMPVITSAFWGRDGMITAAEPWPEVVEHGAQLLDLELLEPAAAIAAVKEAFDWDTQRTALLTSLFARRIAMTSETILIEPEEWRLLKWAGVDGTMEACALLAAIGITVPERTRRTD